MESTLVFVSSSSIAKFKSEQMVDKIDIRQNTTTQAKSFVWAGGIGAVSKTWDKSKDSVISLVRDEEGTTFHMLHNQVTTDVIDSI